MNPARRYGRLYLNFLRFSFSRALEFRLDFYFRIVMDLVFYAVNLAFFRVLYLHTDRLGDWTENQTLLFVALFLIVDAIQMTVFMNNIYGLPFMINDGSLDYYLTRPVSALFFLSLREFAISSFVNFLFAAGILAWAINLNPEVMVGWKWALLPILLLNGAFVQYIIGMLFIIPAFWTHSTSGFGSIYNIFARFSERPDSLFRGALRLVLTTVLPLSLIASFPARILIEPYDGRIIAWLFGVTAAMFGVIVILWKQGLKAYSSASS